MKFQSILISIIITILITSCNNDVFIDRADTSISTSVLPSDGGTAYLKIKQDIESFYAEITRKAKDGDTYYLANFNGGIENRVYYNDSLLYITAERISKDTYQIGVIHNYYPDTIAIDVELRTEFSEEKLSLSIEPRGNIKLGEVEIPHENTWGVENETSVVFGMTFLNGTDAIKEYTFKGQDYPVKVYFSFWDDNYLNLFPKDDVPKVNFKIYDMFTNTTFKGSPELSKTAQDLEGYELKWSSDMDSTFQVNPFENIGIRQLVNIEKRSYDYVLPVYNDDNKKILEFRGKLWLEIPERFEVQTY